MIHPHIVEWVCEEMTSQYGVQVPPHRSEFVVSALYRFSEAQGYSAPERLVAALRHDDGAQLRAEFFDLLLVKETHFFRDPGMWLALAKEVLPAIVERNRATRCLRIWSAACSTGQEVYSLMMLLSEQHPEVLDWAIEVVGTDVSRSALERARTGVYRRAEVQRGLSMDRVHDHLEPQRGGGFSIGDRARLGVRFAHHNLLGQAPGVNGVFDLVLMRNVLMYFRLHDQERALSAVLPHLASEGTLVLGTGDLLLKPVFGLKRSISSAPWLYNREP